MLERSQLKRADGDYRREGLQPVGASKITHDFDQRLEGGTIAILKIFERRHAYSSTFSEGLLVLVAVQAQSLALLSKHALPFLNCVFLLVYSGFKYIHNAKF